MITWALLACTSTPGDPVDTGSVGQANPASADAGWLRGDLHFHTNYSDDALEQGGDWMGPALDIADAYRDATWAEAFPETSQDFLHFVAVTDHRTTDGHQDPDFGHESLVVIGGEEFGSTGHAGIWGHQEHISHESQAGESNNERLSDAVNEAHEAGALFSPNHPLYAGDLWGWDTPGFDAIEVWNGPWSTLSEPTTETQLDEWVASQGVENAAIRVAAQHEGAGQNAQAIRFWQAWLSLDVHVPPVGGGDRHMIFPAGLPTTYVQADAQDADGVLGGIASGATFVSRSPQGPQVLLEARVDGATHPMGSALSGLSAGDTVSIDWTVARAPEGELRLVEGLVDESLPEPGIVETIPITGDLETGTFEWTVPDGGGWLHAVVVDPLPGEIPEEHQAVYDILTTYPDDGGVAALLTAIAPLMDIDLLLSPEQCDPEDWEPWLLMCMPTDTEPYGTFYVPRELRQLMSTEFADGQSTGFAMGAVSAAFHTGAL
ncbi:MAG: CehA/McbA family metallohydrolase [Myxococcota bacterium]|nr:CehA/McbA family metallohydrolase [Myxococcota bacterium]